MLKASAARMAPAVCIAVFISACGEHSDTTDPPVAHAYGDVLHWSDLRQVIPMDASSEDSAALATSYIDNWLREKVLMTHAERNLTDEDKDVHARLEDYRRSLIIFAYEQAIIREKLDTAISAQETEHYYQEDQKNFLLNEDVVRVRWWKVSGADKKEIRRLEQWWRSGAAADLHELELWLAERGITMNDTQDSWITVRELGATIPLSDDGSPRPFTGPEKRIIEESTGNYFVEVLEYRAKGDVSPVSLVAQDIRSILLNKRKVALLERMRADLYSHAMESNEIGTY